MDTSFSPKRTVLNADAIKWLKEQDLLCGSVVTGIPDYSEVGMEVHEWKSWFVDACCLILSKLDENECAIFIQTDVKFKQDEQFEWIDKSYLCNKACEQSACTTLVWHKVVAFNSDIDNKHKKYIYYGKLAGYSHLLCYRKNIKHHTETFPDIIFRGDQIWEKGSGFNACMMVIQYVKHFNNCCKCIIDPFCGKGSVLAVANFLGLDSFGIEIKPALSRKAMNLSVNAERKSGKNNFVWKRGAEKVNIEEGEEDTAEDCISNLFC